MPIATVCLPRSHSLPGMMMGVSVPSEYGWVIAAGVGAVLVVVSGRGVGVACEKAPVCAHLRVRSPSHPHA